MGRRKTKEKNVKKVKRIVSFIKTDFFWTYLGHTGKKVISVMFISWKKVERKLSHGFYLYDKWTFWIGRAFVSLTL